MPLQLEERKTRQTPRSFMQANIFRAPEKFSLDENPLPKAGAGEAVIQVRLTTICGTDIHSVRANTRSSPQTIGHEATGVIHALGPGVTGTRWASGCSWARSRPAANASLASPGTLRRI